VTLGDLLPPVLRRPARRAKNAVRRLLRPGAARDLHLQGLGEGEFEAVGEELLRLVVDLAGLPPDARVLDAGCGLGRLAVPLARTLGPDGRYAGFDVVEDVVWWCRKNLARRDPRLSFEHADVVSAMYNPRGRVAPEAFAFPYPDSAFDRVVAFSLFTHLEAPAAARYLAESARVLRPGGRLLATFFLLDETAEAGIAAGHTHLTFRHRTPGAVHALEDPATPEAAVALPRPWLDDALAQAGLTLLALHPGRWTASLDGLTYQDVVVAERS
jgi:SAM-dependent methyltransferase